MRRGHSGKKKLIITFPAFWEEWIWGTIPTLQVHTFVCRLEMRTPSFFRGHNLNKKSNPFSDYLNRWVKQSSILQVSMLFVDHVMRGFFAYSQFKVISSVVFEDSAL
ncbi:hypothetical protein CDAR_227901 [Caerostris darwini]|uniref:Uncharacterized protein n=1 Tax=Caerostris darwini TaxID=1538125 RepID=A0AAV4VE84_9ARAC|nr:hypothetical protein CDAR_227901 [Caerostris darwini]